MKSINFAQGEFGSLENFPKPEEQIKSKNVHNSWSEFSDYLCVGGTSMDSRVWRPKFRLQTLKERCDTLQSFEDQTQ